MVPVVPAVPVGLPKIIFGREGPMAMTFCRVSISSNYD